MASEDPSSKQKFSVRKRRKDGRVQVGGARPYQVAEARRNLTRELTPKTELRPGRLMYVKIPIRTFEQDNQGKTVNVHNTYPVVRIARIGTQLDATCQVCIVSYPCFEELTRVPALANIRKAIEDSTQMSLFKALCMLKSGGITNEPAFGTAAPIMYPIPLDADNYHPIDFEPSKLTRSLQKLNESNQLTFSAAPGAFGPHVTTVRIPPRNIAEAEIKFRSFYSNPIADCLYGLGSSTQQFAMANFSKQRRHEPLPNGTMFVPGVGLVLAHHSPPGSDAAEGSAVTPVVEFFKGKELPPNTTVILPLTMISEEHRNYWARYTRGFRVHNQEVYTPIFEGTSVMPGSAINTQSLRAVWQTIDNQNAEFAEEESEHCADSNSSCCPTDLCSNQANGFDCVDYDDSTARQRFRDNFANGTICNPSTEKIVVNSVDPFEFHAVDAGAQDGLDESMLVDQDDMDDFDDGGDGSGDGSQFEI